ncbi:ANK-REP-REGION domain-containing protein [Mycena sanguinolenta]|uniref:ANK-REP-REGION domain-containing protein n=1 Tax=Mycena sanguinolenta TaxID=230812 RepID=A0A8H6XC74_9AGAR|nr:ANK-REP-REGION domain-containing protein [Mycena sanguinolenta]
MVSGTLFEPKLYLVPDLSSINALSQTNTTIYRTLNQTLYELCASVEILGKLALLFAVEHQLETTVDKLLETGVSLDTAFNFEFGTESLLHIAAAMGHRAMVVKLLGLYEEGMAHKRCCLTALDCAVLKGHLEVVELLASIPCPKKYKGGCRWRISRRKIKRVPMPEFETDEDYLDLALINSVEAGHEDIAKFLLSQGAHVNFLADERGAASPLWHAVDTGNVEMVQLLLTSGADPNLKDRFGIPPLFKASAKDVAQALVSGGANIHAHGNGSQNVLAYVKDQDLLRFFLVLGIDPNHEDDHNLTPLHFACDLGKEFVEVLLQFGATTVEKANWMGRTPMDDAMRMGKAEVVKLLEPLVQSPSLKEKTATWWKERET